MFEGHICFFYYFVFFYSYLSNFLFIFIAGMMKAVSLAVDLIMAHFNSRQDPEEKVVTRSQFFLSKKKTNSYNRNVKYYPWVQIRQSDKKKLYIV